MAKMDLATTETAASVSGSSGTSCGTRIPCLTLRGRRLTGNGIWRTLLRAKGTTIGWCASHTTCSPPISHHSASLMKYPGRAGQAMDTRRAG